MDPEGAWSLTRPAKSRMAPGRPCYSSVTRRELFRPLKPEAAPRRPAGGLPEYRLSTLGTLADEELASIIPVLSVAAGWRFPRDGLGAPAGGPGAAEALPGGAHQPPHPPRHRRPQHPWGNRGLVADETQLQERSFAYAGLSSFSCSSPA